ncbi:hypothetical protein E5676_scaffold142G00150 [Cucumis melo var. makuwa]|uniref:DUF4283 domain-containing protein n=1 Tax=Cucumis melo var. makuwa TaxID=1194695 RepID=A0A5D3DI32_CUCMM|nr:hypothetical protein E5676_scaffold142G00150 [Cucumis melo var. makuwa]
MEFSYKPFQADKAILYLSPDHAKLLCSNKSANGWSTIGNYQSIPLHLWNYKTFHCIGMACGDFLAVAKETLELDKLIDAKIKVSVRVHGSFETKAADEFDEHNPMAEVYTYNGFQAVPSVTTKSRGGYNHLSSDKHSLSNPTQTKKDSSSDSEYDPFD